MDERTRERNTGRASAGILKAVHDSVWLIGRQATAELLTEAADLLCAEIANEEQTS